MIIIMTSDLKNIHGCDMTTWDSLYSIALDMLSLADQDFLSFALTFFRTGECVEDDAQITARQIELVKRRFVKIPVSDEICSLLDELVDILKYAWIQRVDVGVWKKWEGHEMS